MSNPKVALVIKDLGTIVIELAQDKMPKTVENFLDYVKAGHYDGSIFHRVIRGFMIQGGGFDANMKQKPTRSEIEHEGGAGGRNLKYAVAMARTSAPHSATAQFFINVVDNAFLDYKTPTTQGYGYAVFGQVVEGTEVVEKIVQVKTGRKGFHDDVPVEPVVIESATIIEE